MRQVVIVGASVAGVCAAEELRGAGYDGGLTLLSAEPAMPYNRPPLSKELLTGDLDVEDIALLPDGLDAELGIDLRRGTPALGLDPARATVATADGDLRYDGLVVATGATASLPAAWRGIDGVHTLRSLADAGTIREALLRGPSVVVVGGGFIGLELASAARQLGLSVTVVEALPAPLGRAVDPAIARCIVRLHHEHGVEVVAGRSVVALLGRPRVEQVRLDDGRILPADLVIVGIGARPATGWLEGSGLSLDDGVVTDATLAAGAPGVYAAGDVARWRPAGGGPTRRSEHWTNAREQGTLAARNLLAGSAAAVAYHATPYVWSDQHGRRLQLAGDGRAGELHLLGGGLDEPSFLGVRVRRGVVVGAVALDAPRPFARARHLVDGAAPWADVDAAEWAAA